MGCNPRSLFPSFGNTPVLFLVCPILYSVGQMLFFSRGPKCGSIIDSVIGHIGFPWPRVGFNNWSVFASRWAPLVVFGRPNVVTYAPRARNRIEKKRPPAEQIRYPMADHGVPRRWPYQWLGPRGSILGPPNLNLFLKVRNPPK